MFVVSLTYKVDLSEVEKFIAEHVSFLDKYYAKGHFLISGRKEPRTGGVILAKANSVDVLNTILAEDPFHRENIADYEVTEFIPSKFSNDINIPENVT
jgi:uncharacterized protein YciI